MVNEKEIAKTYVAPQLTVVVFKAAQGYSVSGLTHTLGLGALDENEMFYGDESLEDRQNGGYWGGSNNESWF